MELRGSWGPFLQGGKDPGAGESFVGRVQGTRLEMLTLSHAHLMNDGLKLGQGMFRLSIRSIFFSERVVGHWQRMPREVLRSLFPEVFKNYGDGTRWGRLGLDLKFLEVFPTSMILLHFSFPPCGLQPRCDLSSRDVGSVAEILPGAGPAPCPTICLKLSPRLYLFFQQCFVSTDYQGRFLMIWSFLLN